MRASTLAVAAVTAALALGACGGEEKEEPRTIPFEPPTQEGVEPTIRNFVEALNAGDGKRACELLDDNGQAGVIAFLPSDSETLDCEKAVARVARQIVPLRRFEIDNVRVAGRSATAEVKARNGGYSSGVLLSNRDDEWKISYPPGLRAKSGRPPPPAVPGVPLEQD